MADAGSQGTAKQQPAKGGKQPAVVAEKKEIKILMLHGMWASCPVRRQLCSACSR